MHWYILQSVPEPGSRFVIVIKGNVVGDSSDSVREIPLICDLAAAARKEGEHERESNESVIKKPAHRRGGRAPCCWSGCGIAEGIRGRAGGSGCAAGAQL